MIITSFDVTQDRENLSLSLLESSAATTLKLWTQKTYKTDGLEIDLSTKLDGNVAQTITISLVDIGVTSFDGIYFIEVGDGTDIVCVMTAELSRYKECIMNKVLANENADSCTVIEDVPTMQAQVTLHTLQDAISLGAKQEALVLVFLLDKFCTNTCNSCGEYKLI